MAATEGREGREDVVLLLRWLRRRRGRRRWFWWRYIALKSYPDNQNLDSEREKKLKSGFEVHMIRLLLCVPGTSACGVESVGSEINAVHVLLASAFSVLCASGLVF